MGSMIPTGRVLAGAVAFAFLVAAIGFYAGRSTGSPPGAQAGPRSLPAPVTTQVQGDVSSIDTSKPDWDVPYMTAWMAKPRANQSINGILVGPGAQRPAACPGGKSAVVDAAVAQGSDLGIVATYLPAGARLSPDGQGIGAPAATCDGVVMFNYQRAELPSAATAAERIAAGESWFMVPHGGYITINKWRYPKGASPGLDTTLPADAWEARAINGLPAAVGHPVLDAGLGRGIVTIWDAERSIHTTVVSYQLSFAELLKVAEGIR